MAKFNSLQLDPTEYDFTAFPKQDGEGFCSGKGIIAEPTTDQIDAFQRAARQMDQATDGSTAFSEAREKITASLGELNVPREHLDELPPKYFNRFAGFVLGEYMPALAAGVSAD